MMHNINKTHLEGCFEFTPRIFKDNRGVSIKPYNVDILRSMGIEHGFAEDLMVTSHKSVLRGLHFQKPPYVQAKLIWCSRGSIFDVAVDIRKSSPTYGSFAYFHIDCRKHNIAYIPEGFAHGYQALEEDTTVFYKMSSVYSPENEGGILYNSLGIPWPLESPIMTEKDLSLPDFENFVSAF